MLGLECLEQQARDLRHDPRARNVVRSDAHHVPAPDFLPEPTHGGPHEAGIVPESRPRMNAPAARFEDLITR
jgi:hypothetical protein